MDEQYERLLELKSMTLSPRVLSAYNHFLSSLPPPSDLSLDYVLRYLRPFSDATKTLRVRFFREVFRHLGREDELKGLKAPRLRPAVTANDLYTSDEVRALLMAAKEPMTRALIEVLYESGARCDEVRRLTFDDVRTDEHGITWLLIRQSKTEPRAVPVQECVPSLNAWMNLHPIKTGPIWVARYRGKWAMIGRAAMWIRIRTVMNRAGINNKRRVIHLFRHTRLTELAKRGLSESELSQFAGWSSGSKMGGVYIHLSSRDVQVAMMSKVFGIPVEQVDTSLLLKAKECPRCHAKNPSTAIRCIECGSSLIVDEVSEMKAQIAEMTKMMAELAKHEQELAEAIKRPES